jgi:mycofactocin precursor
MAQVTTDATTVEPEVARDADPEQATSAQLVEEELLVEDVSIDGMCGVY